MLLQQLMYRVELCYRSCFSALNNLCRTILGRQKRFDIVYRLVMFFNKAMGHLQTLCSKQAKHELDERLQMQNKIVGVVDDEYAVNKYLTQTLVSITQVEWMVGQPGHSDILEGILFSVLEHTGRLLSNAVFKEHVATSNRVGNITKGGSPILPEAAKLEARYLVPVLHAAMGRSPARKELIAKVLADSRTASAEQARPRVSSLSNHDLFQKAREMVQNSLLKSAVGGEELEGLRLPTRPEDHVEYAPGVDICVEKYGTEWFLESVWALVGWELAVR
jgi:hypothetical protein